jgi:hypothetical protein
MKHTLLALPAAAGVCAVVLSTNAVLILVALACVVHARWIITLLCSFVYRFLLLLQTMIISIELKQQQLLLLLLLLLQVLSIFSCYYSS